MAWSLEHMPSAILRPFVMSFVTTALAPSPALFTDGAILVNADGERFTDETDAPSFALPDQPDKVAYILLDARIAAKYSAWPHFISTAPGVAYAYVDDYRRNRPDVFMQAPTLRKLADDLGMPPSSLAKSVAQYNETAGNRPKLGEGPYVALGPVRAVFVHAEGGLAVDAEHRVLGDGRSAHPRPLRRRLDRPGRAPTEGPRPPPGLGLRLRPPRRPQRRLPRHHPRYGGLTFPSPHASSGVGRGLG